jgi:DnaJ homolog subfamily C member 19
MVAALLALATAGGVGYYLFRLAPRVASRMQGRATTVAPPLLYQRYVHGFEKTMTEREALLVLGLDGASTTFHRPSKEKVREHYRQVMAHLHSDVGGSPYLATKVNEARDVLAGR